LRLKSRQLPDAWLKELLRKKSASELNVLQKKQRYQKLKAKKKKKSQKKKRSL